MVASVYPRLLRAFNALGPRNTLRRLGEYDKETLWSFCFVCRRFQATRTTDPLDDAEKVLRQLKKLTSEVESKVFGGDAGRVLREPLAPFVGLPQLLVAFSQTLESELGRIGKPGFKSATIATALLAIICEFVRSKTGIYNDEHLAELFQQFEETSENRDFSGDAIRKRRARLKQEYPDIYTFAEERAAYAACTLTPS
jgi:hypothetical protein